MRTLIEILAGIAILANAVIYGTDVFGAIILRPAVASVDDRTLTQLLGRIHRIADRRFPTIGAAGLIASVPMTALAGASGHSVSAAAAALATLALVIFLAIYSRVSKPVNTALTAAALSDRVLGRRSPTPGPLGLSHQRARGAADPRPRRAMRRARRGLTAARRLPGGSPLRSSRRRIVRFANRKEQNEQPGS
jgi:hypothetical protein